MESASGTNDFQTFCEASKIQSMPLPGFPRTVYSLAWRSGGFGVGLASTTVGGNGDGSPHRGEVDASITTRSTAVEGDDSMLDSQG